MLKRKAQSGFTIVELLVVIIVIALLATIVIVAYTGIRQQAAESKRDADLASLKKAIILGRTKIGGTLYDITGNGDPVTGEYCYDTAYNPDGTEPKNLSDSSDCWQKYYAAIDDIGDAANIDLSDLKDGDARGNPYTIFEGEGEPGNECQHDKLGYFNGDGADGDYIVEIPSSLPQCL